MRTHTRLAVLLLAACVAVSAQQTPDRSHPPQPGPPPALHLPTLQKRQLTNGVPVWMVELHEVPVAQVNLVVLSGSADDPAGKFGIASLTAAMLEEGAGSRSALEIADAVDFLGADLSPASAIDSSAVRLHVPVARVTNLSRSLEHLKDRGFFVVGLDQNAPVNIYEASDPSWPLAVVVGAEDVGLSRLVRESCDLVVAIPMAGRTGSMNASAALAAALFGYALRPAR